MQKNTRNQTIPLQGSAMVECLASLRRKVQIEQAHFHRTRWLGLTTQFEQAKAKYKKCRADYVKEIRRNKMMVWRNFVTTKGNTDSWGIVYKILRNKIRNDFDSLHALEERSEYTLTWRDSVMKLLNKMVSANDEEDEADK